MSVDYPAPGSDAARAGSHGGFGMDCECSPVDNGVTHPKAGPDGGPIEDHHGQPLVDVDERTGRGHWRVNPECPMHGRGGPAESAYAPPPPVPGYTQPYPAPTGQRAAERAVDTTPIERR